MAQRIVRVTCPDRPGLVGIITTAFADRGMNILTLDQFTGADAPATAGATVHDSAGGSFFFRAVVDSPTERTPDDAAADAEFERLRQRLSNSLDDSTVEIQPYPTKLRVAVLASQTDHCLVEMIRRAQTGQLAGKVVKVVSNHDVHQALCDFHGIPYEVIPNADLTKEEHEAAVLAAVGDDVDVIVLARYMRILSDDFLQKAPTPIINIHHSFLPSFIGANPYQRAHDRGVKMIGATAHYVTADLDEGPIIEQDVVRVDHRHSKNELVKSGADVERNVLYRAVRAHCEGRIFLDGDRTVVFG